MTMEHRNIEKSFAAINGRTVPKEDKVFGINGRAKAAIAKKGKDAVINATIGALLDDNGDLVVLSSVDEAVKSLAPAEYAEYAPIAGIPAFKEAIVKAALGSYAPGGKFASALAGRHIGVVATPGGTGSIALAISNYTCPGDQYLTHDWCWANYKSMADERGRRLETFEMFDGDAFNLADFEYKVRKLLRIQDRLVIVLNTPGNNPTGYSLSDEEWKGVIRVLNDVPYEKKVALVADVAYIDYVGESDEVRSFIPMLAELRSNILPLIAYSASKTFTFYGCRCAALICLAPNEAVRDEFVKVCSYSARAIWSNSPRGPQAVIGRIYNDPELYDRVEAERAEYRGMLLSRGHAFEEAAAREGLKIVPYRGGFFISIPCENADAIAARLEQQDVFLIPLARGLRVAVASISEEKCSKLPAIIKAAMR